MTEDEAKMKMCPLTFATPEVRLPDGTGIQQGGPYHCMGTDCMAWRWDKNELRHPDSGRVIDVKNADTGYCGLAGAR